MINYKNLVAFIFLLSMFMVSGCEYNQGGPNTNKFTYDDDISDIVHSNGNFYTTNYDLSNNAGDQIDLMVFSLDNNGESVITNRFSLGLNGQGYIALATDDSDLFMQSRSTGNLIKTSLAGELGIFKSDSISTKWVPSGVAYNSENDSLIFLYRDSQINSRYRLRELSKDLSEVSKRDRYFTLLDIDTTHQGALSIAYNSPNLYILAWDGTEDVIISMNYENLSYNSTESLNDSTVVGIDVTDESIFISKREREITKHRDF